MALALNSHTLRVASGLQLCCWTLLQLLAHFGPMVASDVCIVLLLQTALALADCASTCCCMQIASSAAGAGILLLDEAQQRVRMELLELLRCYRPTMIHVAVNSCHS